MRIKIFVIALIMSTASSGFCLQDIPYVKQEILKNKGMCGAATLTMIYQSYGQKAGQKEIFYDVAIPDKEHGGGYCGSSRECLNAMKRGYRAIVIRARQPIALLKLFAKDWDNSHPRIEFTQMPKGNDTSSHATVLVDVTDDNVIVHDPLDKPNRRFGKDTFLYLWAGGENQKNYEFMAVSNKDSAIDKCRICGACIPDYLICPNCRRQVSLQPKEVVGCVYNNCAGRLWNEILCPYCNWYFSEPNRRAAVVKNGSSAHSAVSTLMKAIQNYR